MKKTFLLAITACLIAGNATCQTAIGQQGAEKAGDRIERLISLMTTEEKAGQLSLFASGWDVTGPAMKEDDRKLIREGKAGAILNAYTVDFVRELQRIAVEESRLGIPLLFGYDVIHGHRTIFPIPLAQACSWDLEAIGQAERIAAEEATAQGINWTYAPMVDIARDPRWGRVCEGAGEDTRLGCRIAAARVKGFQGDDLTRENTLMACAKHFAAYGAPLGGRDYNTVDMSALSLAEWYLPPYKACIDAGAGSVMTSFNEIAGIPATCNKWLLTDLLRGEWGFTGFVVTDFTSINELLNHGVAGDLKDAAEISLNAGVDMDLQGGAFLSSVPRLLADGRVSMERVDKAVRDILRAKEKLGLFDDPYRYCNREREKSRLLTPENRAFARKMVTESCVLLKNENSTLPLPAGLGSIAVIGPLADSKVDMLGPWSAGGKAEECVTLLEGIRNRAGKDVKVTCASGCSVEGQDRSGFHEALEAAGQAGFVILVLGESREMSGEAASRSQLGLPGVQEELAEAVIRTGKPVAVVLFNGRPLVLEKLAAGAPAILEAWFGGTEAGNGIADILFGDVNPSGKITMSFPRNEGQIPVFYNGKSTGRPYNPENPDEKYVSRYLDVPNSPLFPFGHGLSYTTFSYSDLSVTVNGQNITAKVWVTNTGDRDGEEVVQLYLHDKVAGVTRPVKELKGFQKVLIRKGETREITFTLTGDDLAFCHPDLKRYPEPGEFILYAGGSSEAALSALFRIE